MTIPRWLRRVERGESRLTTDIEAAYRRSDLTLCGNALYFLFAAISGFAHAWLHAHHDDAGWFSQALIFLPALLVLSGLGRTDERWIAAMSLRVRQPGGVGLAWAAQQAPIRRWHRIRQWPLPVLAALYIAVWPVTHRLDRHPNSTRLEIEFCEQTGLFLCYAVYTAAIHRWLNRKYFREARDALLAAEAALAQEPAAAAGVTTAG